MKRAELEWADLAGRIDPQATLWTWAWSRFPDLVHEQLAGVDETHEVRVTLKNGAAYVGYPDNRKTKAGRLVLSIKRRRTDAAARGARALADRRDCRASSGLRGT